MLHRPALLSAASSSIALAVAALLAACTTVGPDYAGAPATAASGPLARAAQPGIANAAAPVAAAWWQSLGDATLDALVARALADSPDLHAAQARLRESRAAYELQQADQQPTSSASALALGLSSGPGTAAAQHLHFYTAGFDASWEIDLFGGTRRAVESAAARADAVQADLADAQVALAAEVVRAYADLRARERDLALKRELAALDAQSLALTQQRTQRGVDSGLELERERERGIASARAAAEAERDLTIARDRLALLCGQPAGALDAQLGAAPAALPRVPDVVAVGDVTALLQQRPDIRAAERRLAASTAQIGQRKAAYFPKLSLLGDIGLGATEPGQLFKRSSLVLLGAPYLSWNVADFGRTAANVRQAEAGRDEAQARYQASVLQALNDANTALARYGQQRRSFASLREQQDAAARGLELTTQRRRAGVATELDLLDAQRALLEAREQSLSAEAELLQDFASLHKSLGLGWQAGGG
ncbi:MAG: efflux transporter outer membrane subunit [Pelomonas sp.]|nr:efflux transporter outer membrane subunit [Roseateles sp.]